MTSGERRLATERPVQVVFGDVPFGVMMLTPDDLDDFAFGFSLTEGIIKTIADLRGVSVRVSDGGLVLRIDLAGARLHAHLARKRAMSGRTSCGLCGIEDLSALRRAQEAAQGPAPFVPLTAINTALANLERLQPLSAETRAVHGAAWCRFDGSVALVREDVGRHNALDKLIGALLRAGVAADDGFLLITSRASFEMVEKAAIFGCRTLVSISAPTALALERAQALDLTLLGIARRDSVTAFHGADRIIPSA
ncbi:formate dehydrogenase accessory sulfurtransferase FdhD [Lichenihabitans sp. Uapishka_5]|uniref:formate dehydrogenase accessory sulfurtransferase FdhD n=1 Tax=Lichenihabitans sp. Uapishka_5 TaxID=3037302 RepID=UPI0029E81D72|nr:formate dehydrogenase accessory sulfurtransferase FdhD [Lichenihabitans sp. Uapishka_5]MDX7949810.1 formate dehydrogenase accessory sulfurtransferase FdhD [Lichenihabitans sp. Uapishka_5]